MNIICEDCRNAKIIEILQLVKAVLTLKFNIFTTVGLMYFRLFLPNDFIRAQIEGWPKVFWLDVIK